jgi:hypothetical protein
LGNVREEDIRVSVLLEVDRVAVAIAVAAYPVRDAERFEVTIVNFEPGMAGIGVPAGHDSLE